MKKYHLIEKEKRRKMAEGHALEWGQEISQESQFVDIPDGSYDFKVESLERGQHNGSDKIPSCN
jgi:hypothetical protein